MSLGDAMYTALSGMQASSALLNTAAANIANQNTQGYQSLRTNLSSLPDSAGVAVDPSTPDDSESDLAGNIVQLSVAKNMYDANAVVLRTASQMTGTLLDMLDNSDSQQS